MPKHNLHGIKKDERKEEKVERVFVKPNPVNFTAVRSSIDAKINVTGAVSGNKYTFNGAGAVVDVDERDVETLLEKRQGGKHCCGGTGFGNVVFQLVKET